MQIDTSGYTLINEVFPREFVETELVAAHSTARNYQHRVLLETDEWAIQQRAHLRDCLTIAKQHDALDRDCVRRLQSDDDFVFFGRLYELRVAHRLHSAGYRFHFSASGAGRSDLPPVN